MCCYIIRSVRARFPDTNLHWSRLVYASIQRSEKQFREEGGVQHNLEKFRFKTECPTGPPSCASID